jgi:phosphohistidine swiveling domain-containing protein
MAGIGIYNFYWRYLEFADTSMAPFPRRGLKQLGIERNKMADIYPHFEQAFSKAVKIFAKEIACTPKHLLMMTRTELAQTIAHSRLAVYKVELGNRCRGFVYLCTGLHETVSTNRKEIGRMKKYSRSSFHQKPHQELKGMSVQPGRVTGRVIRNLKRRSWPRNPVYVVSNTHPSEIPYLKKVSAIVTDEGGGILSHAAIVSRELRIPCVIGTKIATKVLKDGEMVEVDAKKGIIKKK